MITLTLFYTDIMIKNTAVSNNATILYPLDRKIVWGKINVF